MGVAHVTSASPTMKKASSLANLVRDDDVTSRTQEARKGLDTRRSLTNARGRCRHEKRETRQRVTSPLPNHQNAQLTVVSLAHRLTYQLSTRSSHLEGIRSRTEAITTAMTSDVRLTLDRTSSRCHHVTNCQKHHCISILLQQIDRLGVTSVLMRHRSVIDTGGRSVLRPSRAATT